MRFECTRCGACCYGDWWDHRSIGMSLSTREIEALALALTMGTDEFINKYGRMLKIHPHCSLFDPVSKSCTANSGKPDTCRNWPYLRQMKNPVNLEKGARLCPGITLEPGDLPSLTSGD